MAKLPNVVLATEDELPALLGQGMGCDRPRTWPTESAFSIEIGEEALVARA
jgi:hypothetical protein